MAKTASRVLDRGFARTVDGLVHYRRAGPDDGPRRALVLLHAAPGSSRGLVPLISALHDVDPDLLVLAPDMPGHGDSDPLPVDAPAIADYVAALVRLLDALGLAQVDLYGTHTGARIACEAAILEPDRVRTVIFDGIGDYDPQMRARLIDRYAPEMQPDEYGRQFVWAFNFVRDMSLHFPYFERDPTHRLMTRPVPSPAELHDSAVEVLKGLGSYHKSYRAAFAYQTGVRIGLVRQRTVFLNAHGELPALRAATAEFASSMVDASVVLLDGLPLGKAAAILRHIDTEKRV